MRKLTIYESIDAVRESNGLSKKQLADRMQLSEVQICRYLNGVTKIPAEMLPAFAKAMDCQPSAFFDAQTSDSVGSSSLEQQ